MLSLRNCITGATHRIIQARQFSLTSRVRQEDVSGKPNAAKPEPANDARNVKTLHQLSDFEKKILVWTKKYKTIEEIPESIHYVTMDRARNKFRIKVCNYMLVFTILGCIGMILSGKKAAKRGDSVQKMNQDWHAQYEADKKREEQRK